MKRIYPFLILACLVLAAASWQIVRDRRKASPVWDSKTIYSTGPMVHHSKGGGGGGG